MDIKYTPKSIENPIYIVTISNDVKEYLSNP